MNINDFSDSTSALPEKSRSKRPLIIIIIILLVLAVTAVGCWFIFNGKSDAKAEENYRKYVEPVISNPKLILNTPDPQFPDEYFYEYHSPTDGLGYTVAHDTEKKTIQMQVIQPIVVDENMNTLTEYYWNLFYRYEYGEDKRPQYTAWLQANCKSDDTDKDEGLRVFIQVVLDADFNIVRANGKIYKEGKEKNTDIKELTGAEALETYEKYKADLSELRGKLYKMFGEEHFRK